MSATFRHLNSAEFDNRLDNLKEIFFDFTKHHTTIAILSSSVQRAELESVYAEMDRIYAKVTRAYRHRMDQLQCERYLVRQSGSLDVEEAAAARKPAKLPATDTRFGPLALSVPKEQPKNTPTTKCIEQPLIGQRAAVDEPNMKPLSSAVVVKSVVQRAPGAQAPARERSRSPLHASSDLRNRLGSGAVPRCQRVQRAQRGQQRPQATPRPTRLQCNACQGPHPMHLCREFLNSLLYERWVTVGKKNLCANCFMPAIATHRCRKAGHCPICGPGKFHNSLLCPYGYY